jgi:PIN domain nuclease of toxin-antitoxin system
VRISLETHAMYWCAAGDPQLSPNARVLIRDACNEVLISPASCWESAIKVRLGKWVLHRPCEEFLDTCLNVCGFRVLPIEPKHTALLTTMPLHHRDPFDRLLVAQALAEAIPLVSGDRALDAWGVNRQ